MKISIITVCYNAEETIADCLHSVAAQSHVDIEHLIIDGASTDETQEIATSLATTYTRIVSEPDQGIYFALNKGIELATGDVIGFLHADDVFGHDEVLAQVCSTLSSEIDACYADLVYVKKRQPDVVVRNWKSDNFESGLFQRGWMPPHPTFYAKRSVYNSHGSFDTSLRIGADWELLVRFMEIHQIPTAYVPETWVRMRLGGMSNRSLRNVARNNWETWKLFRRHFGFIKSLMFPPRKWLHRIRQFSFSTAEKTLLSTEHQKRP